MENVEAFNIELSGLYESKPPISKAKMAAITRAAMRAIKLYKHVVQSVEKFILKCKPEYKVPGLYVIDSIVRQSRHQYGPEKDVFAPRFARNMKDTFANLFRCAPEDKSRIIRVLNLWQKNNVFAPDVIQPIFDLADPNHPIYSMPPPGTTVNSAAPSGSVNLSITDMPTSQANGGLNTSSGSMDMNLSGAGLVQQEEKLPGSGLADLSSASPHERSRITGNSLRQLEHKQHSKRSNNSASNMASTSKFREHSSKSTLESIKIHHPETYSKYQRSHDYDYDDGGGHHIADNDASSDECGSSPKNSNNFLDNNNLKQLLNDPNVLRQLQTLQNFTKFKQDDKQHSLRLQEEAFEKHLQNVLKTSAPGAGSATQDVTDFNKEVEFVSEEQKIEVINLDANDSRSPSPDRDRYKRRRSRSRSRSRDRGGRNRRGRSRSRSRSRSPRSNRRRSSRERDRNNRDKERDREHERERRKKGLPDIKKEHLSVCSTTLWVGHLSKLVYQEELSDTFGEYGDIVSIDQIVPRGCAFIVMNRRQDAYKAMQGLKNHKLQGRAITISWAAGKGVKSKEWKDFWDLDLGVTYIPWSKIDESTDFDALEEGGMFDEDSMPAWMKEKISNMKSLKESANEHSKLVVGGGISGPPPTLAPSGNPGIIFGIDTTQPPPGPPPTGGPPPILPLVPGQFTMAPPMSGPPRMLGPPHMGMPISGIHMPPNIVPPHGMMMLPPGFGMGGPSTGPPMGPPHIPAMGGPHGTHSAQFPPPTAAHTGMTPNVSSDDQMDIEMEDEDGATLVPVNISSGGGNLNFSHPPPSFATGSGGGEKSSPSGEPFSRERSRIGGAGSRWGARGSSTAADDENVDARWRENGGSHPQGGHHNFSDGLGARNTGGPPLRPDYMNDFDKRGGPGPRGTGSNQNFNGGSNDFHPNMQNRFNQPTNLMQMRIPPPNAFNQRAPGGGPPMFMRGGPGCGSGRQQGPGFFNRNNPFDRDISEVFGRGRGRGGRGGGGRGGRGGAFAGARDGAAVGGIHSGNWSDEEGDEGIFKRRGGNRFRDREGSADRFNMRDNNNRGGRRGGGPSRERNDNERDIRSGRSLSAAAGSSLIPRVPRDDNYKKTARITDTEEDWDRELEDYDSKKNNKDQTDAIESSEILSNSLKSFTDNEKPTLDGVLMVKPDTRDIRDVNIINTTTKDDSDINTKSATPLYDEVAPPKANLANIETNTPADETTAIFTSTETNEIHKPLATDVKADTADTNKAIDLDPQSFSEVASDSKPENAEKVAVGTPAEA